MTTISDYFSRDHQRCDALFAVAESALQSRDCDAAVDAARAFAQALERHFAMEERGLFPALSARTGGAGGPIHVMRAEHAQMRDLLRQLTFAADAGDRATGLELTETLLVLMQQHNMKEEGILYPLADRVFGEDADEAVHAALEAAA
jgi:hemerythrin-like domain-containing protein